MGSVEDPNIVLQITISKLEPECINYAYKVKAAYARNKPEYIEQLAILKGFVAALEEEGKELNLDHWVSINRDVRVKMMEERIDKEAKDADDRPEGRESEPN